VPLLQAHTCWQNSLDFHDLDKSVCWWLQVLADAAAIDAKASAGQDITPLCGMPLAVKDSINVLGYRTTGATPALASKHHAIGCAAARHTYMFHSTSTLCCMHVKHLEQFVASLK